MRWMDVGVHGVHHQNYGNQKEDGETKEIEGVVKEREVLVWKKTLE